MSEMDLEDNRASDFGRVVEGLRRVTVGIRGPGPASGSGVICSHCGEVVTNAHVAVGRRATVDLWDGRSFESEVLRRDAGRDLALLRIDPGDLASAGAAGGPTALPAAVLGNSDRLRAGELAIAIGNPLGFRGAMSAGVIHQVGSPSGMGGREWVIADVRLAPGNSGGPLADAEGRVIGINTMVAGRLALAVPSNAVATFLRKAAIPGAAPVLGVVVRPLRLRLREAIDEIEAIDGAGQGGSNGGRVGSGHPGHRGSARAGFALQVLDVAAGSAAEAASVRRGDLLVGAEGKEFRSIDDLDRALDTLHPIQIQFRRGNMRRTRSVTVPLHERSASSQRTSGGR
jgi:serine protease Do